MSRHTNLQRVLDGGLVAIIRAPRGEQLLEVVAALLEGGIDVIEVTFTVPGVLDVIRDVRTSHGDRMLLGAGTVLDTETARAAILAGVDFIVTPTANTGVIRLCKRYDKLVMPGAFTPTEVLAAWEAGADIVKVFPADSVGPAHIRALNGPFPHIRLLPTGGVNLRTLGDFVKAGACAVGLGSALVEKETLARGDMARISALARQYVAAMKAARKGSE